jgi:hypothetical protein
MNTNIAYWSVTRYASYSTKNKNLRMQTNHFFWFLRLYIIFINILTIMEKSLPVKLQ